MDSNNDIGGVFGETLKHVDQSVMFWSMGDASKRLSEQPVTATTTVGE